MKQWVVCLKVILPRFSSISPRADGGGKLPRKTVARFDVYRVESKPRRHHPQFGGEPIGDLAGLGSRLDVGCQREQPALRPISLQVNATDQTLAEQERQHIITPTALILRSVYLDTVIESEEPRRARAMPYYRIERRQQRRRFNPAWRSRLRVKIRRLLPPFDARLT